MEAVLAASSFYLKHKFYRITPKVHKTNNIKWLISPSIGLKLRSQNTFTTYLAELVSSGAVRGWWVLVAERCTVCGHFSASSDRWTHLRRCGLAGTRYSFRPETGMLFGCSFCLVCFHLCISGSNLSSNSFSQPLWSKVSVAKWQIGVIQKVEFAIWLILSDPIPISVYPC